MQIGTRIARSRSGSNVPEREAATGAEVASQGTTDVGTRTVQETPDDQEGETVYVRRKRKQLYV